MIVHIIEDIKHTCIHICISILGILLSWLEHSSQPPRGWVVDRSNLKRNQQITLPLVFSSRVGWRKAASEEPQRTLRLPQPLRHIGGEIGNDHIRTRPSYTRQHLHCHPPLINPAILGGGLDHRKFTAHIIGGNR